MFADECVEPLLNLTGFTSIARLYWTSRCCCAGEMKLLSFFLALFVLNLVKCEFYSSTDKLKELFDHESEILLEFTEIIHKLNDVNDQLFNKIKPWFDEHVVAQDDVNKYVTNPLNAYLLIKRNVYDAKMLENRVSLVMDEVNEKLQKIKAKSFLHSLEVTGAVAGLVRAQRTYHLKCDDLVEGIVDGSVTRARLSPHDVFILANETFYMAKEEYFAEKYLQIADEKISKNEDTINEVDKEEIEEKLKVFETMEVQDPYDEYYGYLSYRHTDIERIITHQVCRGALTRSAKETKHLHCKFVSFTPFSSIAPFKLEEANHDPYIVIYHEVISEAEVDTLLAIARPKQRKALVGLEDSFASDSDRVAQLSWLYDGDHQIVNLLNPRFEDMTGLAIEDPFGEAMQIQNYGVGGQYYAHHDNDFARTDDASEDRIATLMLYVRNLNFVSVFFY